jgi:hypothetical protein
LVSGKRFEAVQQFQHHLCVTRVARLRRDKPLGSSDQPEDPRVLMVKRGQLKQDLARFGRRVPVLSKLGFELRCLLIDYFIGGRTGFSCFAGLCRLGGVICGRVLRDDEREWGYKQRQADCEAATRDR